MVENSSSRKGDVSDKLTERSFKEKRIREITLIYYMRSDIKRALFEFGKDREIVPRYYEGFGKRPDNFQYEGDVLEYIRRGATSFHCSEELWRDALEINTEMGVEEFNDLRIGWDLLLDIDSPYLEYSKIYTKLIVDSLKFHGLKNISVKFSGNKGFHIIVPWKAFPKEIYGRKTKDMFPDWARVICEYLGETIKDKLSDEIFKDENLKSLAEKTGKKEEDLVIDECLGCHRPAISKYLVTWICECKRLGEIERLETSRKVLKCPECRSDLIEKSRKEIYFCEFCNLRSDKDSGMFAKTREKTEILIDADLVLVAPRHLFRMPYSLHEKTALASVVIDKEKVMDFQISDAKPFKVVVKDYYPVCVEGEAKDLLLQALDWKEQRDRDEKIIERGKESTFKREGFVKKKDYQKVVIEEPPEEIFPPQIKNILKGIKHDGRKRALFVLLSFFKSLGANEDWIEKKVFEWNERNYMPLKKGYIISQLSWYRRSASRLPPNFSNTIYRELGVDGVDDLVRVTKNPVSYAVKKYFQSNK